MSELGGSPLWNTVYYGCIGYNVANLATMYDDVLGDSFAMMWHETADQWMAR